MKKKEILKNVLCYIISLLGQILQDEASWPSYNPLEPWYSLGEVVHLPITSVYTKLFSLIKNHKVHVFCVQICFKSVSLSIPTHSLPASASQVWDSGTCHQAQPTKSVIFKKTAVSQSRSPGFFHVQLDIWKYKKWLFKVKNNFSGLWDAYLIIFNPSGIKLIGLGLGCSNLILLFLFLWH